MYRKRKPRRNRRWVALFFLLVFAGAGWLWGGAFFPAEHMRDVAVNQLNRITGQQLTVKGAPYFTLCPTPTLTLPLIEIIPQGTGAEQAPHLRAENLVLGFSWGSIVNGEPVLTSLALNGPALELIRAEDALPVIGWLSAGADITGLSQFNSFIINNGRIVLSDASREASERIEQFTLVGKRDGEGFVLHGQGRYRAIPLQWEANVHGAKLEASIAHDAQTFLHFAGNWQGHGEALVLAGALNAAIADAALLSAAPAPEKTANSAHTPAYPVGFNGTLHFSRAENILHISDIAFTTADGTGKGDVGIALGQRANVLLSLSFSKLAVPIEWLSLLFSSPATSPEHGGKNVYATEEKALPADYDVTLDVTADTLSMERRNVAKFALKTVLKEGKLTVNQLNFALPGNGDVAMQGEIIDTANGQGESLRNLLALFDPAANSLPEQSFGKFSIASNMFISSGQLRLSEANVMLGELNLQGGLVTYFENKPRVEADILLKDINLDYFRNAWRGEQQRKGTHDFIFRVNSNVDFNWLRQLTPLIDLKIRLHNFTFLDRRGDTASMRLYAQQNQLGLRDIDMHYPEGNVKGSIAITLQEAADIAIQLETPFFDTGYFSENETVATTPLVNTADAQHRWSDKLFDFGWMIGVAGKINLKAAEFIHQGVRYGHLALEGDLKNERFQCSKLSFEHFGGRIDATGTLLGGKVPGLSASFTLYNAGLSELLSSFSNLSEPNGRISISGTVVTSGIHFLSWIEQADAKLIIAARGVSVPHFNLQGVVNAVNTSSSVAQVVNNVERILPSGNTEMSIDGNINLLQGILNAPSLKLRAGPAVGTLAGEWRLIPWSLRLTTLWQLPQLASETVPTLTLDVAGTPEAHVLKTDTSALEAYVAKRIVGE